MHLSRRYAVGAGYANRTKLLRAEYEKDEEANAKVKKGKR